LNKIFSSTQNHEEMPHGLKDDLYRQVRDDKEYPGCQLKDCHSRIVDAVELFIAHLEPLRMHPVYPISGAHKHKEPYQQETEIKNYTPQ
jgi:hypothetical protein